MTRCPSLLNPRTVSWGGPGERPARPGPSAQSPEIPRARCACRSDPPPPGRIARPRGPPLEATATSQSQEDPPPKAGGRAAAPPRQRGLRGRASPASPPPNSGNHTSGRTALGKTGTLGRSRHVAGCSRVAANSHNAGGIEPRIPMRHDNVPHWPGDPFGLAGAPAPLGRSRLRTLRSAGTDEGQPPGAAATSACAAPLRSAAACERRAENSVGTSFASGRGGLRYAAHADGPPGPGPAAPSDSWPCRFAAPTAHRVRSHVDRRPTPPLNNSPGPYGPNTARNRPRCGEYLLAASAQATPVFAPLNTSQEWPCSSGRTAAIPGRSGPAATGHRPAGSGPSCLRSW